MSARSEHTNTSAGENVQAGEDNLSNNISEPGNKNMTNGNNEDNLPPAASNSPRDLSETKETNQEIQKAVLINNIDEKNENLENDDLKTNKNNDEGEKAKSSEDADSNQEKNDIPPEQMQLGLIGSIADKMIESAKDSDCDSKGENETNGNTNQDTENKISHANINDIENIVQKVVDSVENQSKEESKTENATTEKEQIESEKNENDKNESEENEKIVIEKNESENVENEKGKIENLVIDKIANVVGNEAEIEATNNKKTSLDSSSIQVAEYYDPDADENGTESENNVLVTIAHNSADIMIGNNDSNNNTTPRNSGNLDSGRDPNNTSNSISEQINGPRIVQRREYEKADACVQHENDNDSDDDDDDSFFATAVDSPRVRESESGRNDQNDDDDDNDNDEDNYVPPLQPIELFSADELHSALQKLLNTKKLPPMEMRESLINYARKQSLYQLMAEDYDQAAKIDDAIDTLLKSLQQEDLNAETTQQNLTLAQRLEDAKNKRIIMEEKHKQRIDDFKRNEQQRLEDLQQQHEIDRRAFEAEWSSEEVTRQFNKPSSSLFQIRRQQKAFAISHDFANAKALKKIGDAMQKEESIIASIRATDTMRTQYVALLAKQQKEMNCLIEYGKRRLNQLETERDAELKANEIYRNALEARIKNPKTMRRPRVQIPRSVTRSDSRRPSITGVVSVRTRSQYSNYKKTPDKTRLEVKIGDVRKITKPLTPSPRKGKKGASTLPSPFA
ncbi:hypothetical protein TRFO_34077 [Tritrichomonas foetus]|uniref:Uncharacterized protein n=1 Tax=Tritrichomonas foetus TaxID=1144522 RepID=A0A1J4JK13_9EUKA|nr:hypothetical protein TRFO_34077 [Tritrichomonas foetus]|eukprot:OHS99494.1 hypothetical protein TRFO_34077 [Tritrichomonas foetus]